MVPPQDDFTVSASLSEAPSLTRTTLMVVTLNKRPLFSLLVTLYFTFVSVLLGFIFDLSKSDEVRKILFQDKQTF